MFKLLLKFIAWVALLQLQVLYVYAEGSNTNLNVLFIIIDDLRTEVGSYRSNGDEPFSKSVTPEMDKLAADSLQFQRAYVQVALCGPSRASFLSGRRPQSLDYYVHNLDDVKDADIIDKRLPNGLVTLPKYFQNKGYVTRGAGKVFHSPANLKNQYQQSLPTKQDRCDDDLVRCTVASESGLQDNDMFEWGRNQLRSLKNSLNSDQRFFMTLGIRKPHMPFKVTKEHEDYVKGKYPDGVPIAKETMRLEPMAPSNYFCQVMDNYMQHYEGGFSTQLTDPFHPFSEDMSSFLRTGYYSAIKWADKVVGNLVDEIKDLGILQNTLIVVTSDNGYHLGEHGNWCKNTNSELNTRVPLWVRHPNAVEQNGKKSNDIVSLIDLYPTIVELAGLQLDETVKALIAGNSFADTVLPANGRLRRRADDSNLPKMAFSVSGRCLKGNGELSKCEKRNDLNVVGFTVREDRWRYTEWRQWQGSYNNAANQYSNSEIVDQELYDHYGDDGTDPDNSENENLAKSEDHSEIVNAFAKVLNAEYGCEGPDCFEGITIPDLPVPSSKPTSTPTQTPSRTPTASPTPKPTLKPTLKPTTKSPNANSHGHGKGEENTVDKDLAAKVSISVVVLGLLAIFVFLYIFHPGAKAKVNSCFEGKKKENEKSAREDPSDWN